MAIRKSKKRDLILELFSSSNHLLSATDIARLLPQMNQATIYRNLKRFLNEGVIREINIQSGISYYELNSDNHQHFVCNDCGEITPIHLEIGSLIEKSVPVPHKIVKTEVNVFGICQYCLNKEKKA
jgi:Fe2+ or Zn2+ uptake regulation protein